MTKEEYFFNHPKDNTLEVLYSLISQYGDATTLEDAYLRTVEKVSKRHCCPKCKGNGYLVREYNSYPSGLPDSGWVYKPGYDYYECDLCHGKGYTDKKYVPKTETKVIGYEVEE